MMAFAQSLSAKLDAVGMAVSDIRREQGLQTAGMELLHAASEAQTKAISTLQAAEAKHAAFYAKLQQAHQDAIALNDSPVKEGMDEEGAEAAFPSEDSMTATRQ